MRRLHQSLTCAALLMLGLTGQSQAGFLDFLFGGQQQLGNQRPVYVPAYAPPSRPTLMRPKVHDRIRKISASVDGDVPKNAREATLANIRKLDAVAKTEGIKAAFLKDQTARPGDILVTAEGLAVYERNTGGAQLRPLAESRYKDRTDLQMLQKVGKVSPVKNPDVDTHEASNDQTPRNVRTAEISQ